MLGLGLLTLVDSTHYKRVYMPEIRATEAGFLNGAEHDLQRAIAEFKEGKWESILACARRWTVNRGTLQLRLLGGITRAEARKLQQRLT